MKEGFQKYTGRRAMIYTPCMYAGQQQYCATWAGDTGGGYKTMVSIQNLAMCGHSNASCDMDVTQLSSIHYCALMPWMQHLGWRNWQDPWFLGDELEGIYRDYAQLRSSLFPYIYSMAHRPTKRGCPWRVRSPWPMRGTQSGTMCSMNICLAIASWSRPLIAPFNCRQGAGRITSRGKRMRGRNLLCTTRRAAKAAPCW